MTRPPLFLDNFHPGQTYQSPAREVTEEEIRTFASHFDPQPFHLDHQAAEASFFKGLAASGWHTAAITMRLLVDSEMTVAGGIVGAGIDELRWLQPVRPGDFLGIRCEILEVRPMRSKPDQGIVRVRVTTSNQRGEAVQSFVASLVVPSASRAAA